MGQEQTMKPTEKFNSSVGLLKILAEKDGWKQKVELWLLNSEVNRNNWQYLNLEQHKGLFAETPILIAYKGDQLGDGHNFDKVELPNGQVVASFMGSTSERPVGFFPTNAEMRIEEKDGKEWIVGVGWIWKWYAQELVAHLKEQGLEGMSISIETLIDEMYMNGDTEVFTKYQILGTTILHETVAPAVADARIRALSALGIDNIRKETLRVASMYQERNKNPQTKNNKEKQTIMNKKSLKDMFKGCQILEVVGNKVALLSCDKHEAFVSSVTKDDSGALVEGGKIAVNATVVFGEGENEVKVALDSVIEQFKTENEELKTQLADKEETIKALSKANEKMQTQETERRKEAVKTAIDNRFAEIKANSDADFADNECDELKTDEKINAFIAMEDQDGKFIGDTEAVKAVDARCMSKIIEAHKVRANSQKKTYAWDMQHDKDGNKKNADDIDATVAEFSGN